MIKWNFNMDEAPREIVPFLAWCQGTSAELVYWSEYAGCFESSSHSYSPEKFSKNFTAWARINPPVRGE
jgi:hypothetical protein